MDVPDDEAQSELTFTRSKFRRCFLGLLPDEREKKEASGLSNTARRRMRHMRTMQQQQMRGMGRRRKHRS